MDRQMFQIGKIREEERYYISSLQTDIEEIVRAVRGHWMVENYHWHLDVTFRLSCKLPLSFRELQ